MKTKYPIIATYYAFVK